MDFKNYLTFFADKRITLMGLGLLGRGVGDAEFLAQCGATVLATDVKTAAELAPSVEYLRKKYANITFRLGSHEKEDFQSCDMVIKAAGVPIDSPFIAAAREKAIPIYMSGALFAKFAREMGVRLIGVTGTRGKSTITHMIFHTLETAGKRAILGGNVRGRSTLAKISEAREGDIAVLELDSWQLQGFGDLAMSPEIAIFSNLMPDHLNYYPDMQSYFRDKANIFRHQAPTDALFVESSVSQIVADARPPAAIRIPPPIPAEWRLKIMGEHNRVNAALAAAALRVAGLLEDEIRTGLESFEGIEGRFQLVREIDGVKIINDNNATTPAATLAALNSVPVEKTVLIMGGSDKGLDMRDIIAIAKKCKGVVLMSGTGTDRISKEFSHAVIAGTIADAMNASRRIATAGDYILFSPAFASFGMFKNEYDRNDQFLKIVQSL
jgi:UDP-N-acetylmuramoylalanine--D-glutamate ligase